MISRIIEVEVGVISRSRRLRLITLTKTSIILNITKTESNNYFIIHWTEKIEVISFASSLTPRSIKRANLTRLLLETMHRGHTWHDYPWPWHDYSWPWHDYCIICKFWRHGRWFRKFTVGFWPIKKELESWIYNNNNNNNNYYYYYYYTFSSLTLFWLDESQQWIFEISARDVKTCRLYNNHVNPYLDLDYSGYHKTSYNNCLLLLSLLLVLLLLVIVIGPSGVQFSE